jgi:hypothetical protein
MVRRIQSDSDFDSDAEDDLVRLGSAEQVSSLATPVSSPRVVSPSPRRVVTRRQLKHIDHGTYEYDSDKYTDESSLASFIVYTDEEEENYTPESENGSILSKERLTGRSRGFHRFSVPGH